MAVQARKRLRTPKNRKSHKSKPKPQGIKMALTLSPKEKPLVPIEEIRRQGLMLAWQGIGEATRARTLVPAAATRVRAALPAAPAARPSVAAKPGVKRAAAVR